jgi:hypothetical protein
LAEDLRARDAAVDFVPLRAGALVVLRALPFFAALRAGALVVLRAVFLRAVLRAGARVALRVVFRVDLRALVVLRAGALVALRVVFRVDLRVDLRAGALVVLRAALVVFRAVFLGRLAADFDVLEADLVAFLALGRVVFARRLAAGLALPLVLATRFSADAAAFLIAAMESPTASWRRSPPCWSSR